MLNLKLEANTIISNPLILHQSKHRLFKNCLTKSVRVTWNIITYIELNRLCQFGTFRPLCNFMKRLPLVVLAGFSEGVVAIHLVSLILSIPARNRKADKYWTIGILETNINYSSGLHTAPLYIIDKVDRSFATLGSATLPCRCPLPGLDIWYFIWAAEYHI